MKIVFILFLLFPGYGYSQSKAAFQKQYVVEGVIVKGTNFEPVPFMVLRNAKLGVSAISDEHGYYSLSFPLSYVKDNSHIQIDLEKTGQNPGKFWFSYNPIDSNVAGNVAWNYDLKFIHIIERDTNLIYQVGAHRRIQNDHHGYSGIQDAVDEYIKGRIREERTERLMADNQKVLFKMDHRYVLAMVNSVVWLDDEKLEIYFNDKRVKPRDINKLVKRNEVKEDPKRFHAENKDPKVYKWFLIPAQLTEADLFMLQRRKDFQ